MDRPDVRMIEGREQLRFAPEPRETVGVERESCREDLQRDVAIQPAAAGPIHLAHAASTDERQNFIGAELRTGGERHQTVEECRLYAGAAPRNARKAAQIRAITTEPPPRTNRASTGNGISA